MTKSISLLSKKIGDGFPCYIIGEIGNSFQTFEEAKRLIDSAKEIGMDAIKFQTWDAETVTTKSNYFDFEVTGHISQYEQHKKLQISSELQHQIMDYANNKNMLIFSAPSHIQDLKLMDELEIPIYKIGSDLACHIPLLKKVAKLGKPIILSTGMCTLEEVRSSVNSILDSGNDQLAILHCISNYPCTPEETNLNIISTMKNEFNLPVGLSDHNLGHTIALGAAAMGANIIEKHFRDQSNTPSPDDPHALFKNEFLNLVQSIRLIEKAKGSGIKKPTSSEQQWMNTNRVSVVSLKDIKKEEIITKDSIDIRRPGNGIQPIYFDSLLGKKSKTDIKKETPLTWDMIE